MQITLDQLIKKYGVKGEYKKGDLIFKANDSDFGLYFIENGNISLEKNGYKLINLGSGEIIGEKSFLQKEPKPLDALAIENETVVYKLDISTFESFSMEEKESIYGQLTLFLSQRVYKLNDVLTFIASINTHILAYSTNFDKNVIIELFNKLIDLKGYAILKYEYKELQKIESTINVDLGIIDFVQGLIYSQVDIKVGQNYVYIKSDEYIYLMFGEPKVEYYILVNALLYAKSIFKYLGEKIEANRNKEFLETM